MNPWLSLFSDLSLSRQEKEVVERFNLNPAGLGFLPLVEILKNHKLVDEAIELLTWGVERHPHYPAARVLLAKELYLRGMVQESYNKLQVTHLPLGDNVLAQNLLLKGAILLGYESSARGILQHMKRQQMLDGENRNLGNTFEIEGLGKARAKIIAEFKRADINPLLPSTAADESQLSQQAAISDLAAPALASQMTISKDFLADQKLGHFHVVPLAEIFQPGDGQGHNQLALGGMELDTPTLAEIYAKQGHYSKSLAVYRRLLKISPHNEYLRKMVTQTAKMEQEQRQNDLTVDPALVDKMEAVELLDRKMRLYTHMLDLLAPDLQI